MRTKATSVMYFDFSGISSIKVAQEYRARYEILSQILDDNPALLARAHRDWSKLLSSSSRGRDGYTSEQLLRALIVMFIEGDSYRDVVIRIDTSEFLQYFVRLGVRPTMDFTFLCKAFCVLSERTLEKMNHIVAQYALQQAKISGDKQRMDTTVYEANTPSQQVNPNRSCNIFCNKGPGFGCFSTYFVLCRNRKSLFNRNIAIHKIRF